MGAFLRRLISLFRRLDRDLDDELAFHLRYGRKRISDQIRRRAAV